MQHKLRAQLADDLAYGAGATPSGDPWPRLAARLTSGRPGRDRVGSPAPPGPRPPLNLAILSLILPGEARAVWDFDMAGPTPILDALPVVDALCAILAAATEATGLDLVPAEETPRDLCACLAGAMPALGIVDDAEGTPGWHIARRVHEVMTRVRRELGDVSPRGARLRCPACGSPRVEARCGQSELFCVPCGRVTARARAMLRAGEVRAALLRQTGAAPSVKAIVMWGQRGRVSRVPDPADTGHKLYSYLDCAELWAKTGGR